MKMKGEIRFALLSAALAAFTLPGLAQSTSAQAAANTTTPSSTAAPSNDQVNAQTINQRKDNQQDRIANGERTGQLTAGESANLENKESKLNQEEHDMRSEDNGHLTATDKAAITQQQNKLSNQIYQDKHNAATQTTDPKSEVGQRAENQQDRIAQGVKSGQLTSGEAAHLESNEAKINNEVRNDRAANGGKLTDAEKAQVNRQQNRQSRQIFQAKHNGRVR
jgi:hypothetical protein